MDASQSMEDSTAHIVTIASLQEVLKSWEQKAKSAEGSLKAWMARAKAAESKLNAINQSKSSKPVNNQQANEWKSKAEMMEAHVKILSQKLMETQVTDNSPDEVNEWKGRATAAEAHVKHLAKRLNLVTRELEDTKKDVGQINLITSQILYGSRRLSPVACGSETGIGTQAVNRQQSYTVPKKTDILDYDDYLNEIRSGDDEASVAGSSASYTVSMAADHPPESKKKKPKNKKTRNNLIQGLQLNPSNNLSKLPFKQT